jgi:hypothetical protein
MFRDFVTAADAGTLSYGKILPWTNYSDRQIPQQTWNSIERV